MRYVDDLDVAASAPCTSVPEDRSLGAAFWARYGCALEFAPRAGGLVHTVRELARGERREHPDDVLAVVVPEQIEEPRLWHVLRHNDALRLKAGLLFERGVVVVNVPAVGERQRTDRRAARVSTSRSCRCPRSTAARVMRCGSPGCSVPTACAPCTSPSSAEDAEALEAAWAANSTSRCRSTSSPRPTAS